MLDDAEGRWPSTSNAASFVRMVSEMIRAIASTPAHAPSAMSEILLDLEPPFHAARILTNDVTAMRQAPRLVRDAWRFARSPRTRLRERARAYRAGKDVLTNLVRTLHDEGLRTSSAVWPLTVLDASPREFWQTLLGTPVDALETSRVSVMAYTTIFEGWSRGLVRREDALALLSHVGARARTRWPNAGVSLGCVGTGAFENEPVYRTPRELAEDVAVVRDAGCDDLSLFDFAGVLSRPPAEAWLEAFVHGIDGAPIGTTPRVQAVRALVKLTTHLTK